MGKLRPRKHDRVRHLSAVKYRVGLEGPILRGHTIDLSRSGVRLFCVQSPTIGETIDLTWSDCDPPLTVGGRIVYVKFDLEGSSAGVVFHQPISPALFHTLQHPQSRPVRR